MASKVEGVWELPERGELPLTRPKAIDVAELDHGEFDQGDRP